MAHKQRANKICAHPRKRQSRTPNPIFPGRMRGASAGGQPESNYHWGYWKARLSNEPLNSLPSTIFKFKQTFWAKWNQSVFAPFLHFRRFCSRCWYLNTQVQYHAHVAKHMPNKLHFNSLPLELDTHSQNIINNLIDCQKFIQVFNTQIISRFWVLFAFRVFLEN